MKIPVLLLTCVLAPVTSSIEVPSRLLRPQPVIGGSPDPPTNPPTVPPTDPPTPPQGCPQNYTITLLDFNENNELLLPINASLWEAFESDTRTRWVDNEVFDKESGKLWGWSTGSCTLLVKQGRWFFDDWDVQHTWNCIVTLTKDSDSDWPAMDGNQLEFHGTYVFYITFSDVEGEPANATASEHHRVIKYGGTGCLENTRDIETGCSTMCSEYGAVNPYTEYVLNVQIL